MGGLTPSRRRALRQRLGLVEGLFWTAIALFFSPLIPMTSLLMGHAPEFAGLPAYRALGILLFLSFAGGSALFTMGGTLYALRAGRQRAVWRRLLGASFFFAFGAAGITIGLLCLLGARPDGTIAIPDWVGVLVIAEFAVVTIATLAERFFELREH